MRIVGGEWRGRPIDSPKGRDVSRPTTDRVREAIASMLESALPEGIEGSRVLDAFAGSGALGLEVLSRGAEHAVFFDLDRSAAALVKRNLAKLSCAPARFQVMCGDVIASAADASQAGRSMRFSSTRRMHSVRSRPSILSRPCVDMACSPMEQL